MPAIITSSFCYHWKAAGSGKLGAFNLIMIMTRLEFPDFKNKGHHIVNF